MENEEKEVVVATIDEATETEVKEVTEEAKAEKPKRTPEEELAYFEGRAKRLRKDLGIEGESKKDEKPAPAASGLDETQLDYLDLKGISEDEDIEVIQKVIAKTGQTVRQVLKDDYVIAKLAALKAERDVKDATPSSTKRSGTSTSNDVDTAIAHYERTKELPADFQLRSAVVNRLEARSSASKPSWRR